MHVCNVHPSPAGNAKLNVDPTRTTALRAKFIRDGHSRLNKLIRDVRISIVDEDCFGIQPNVQKTPLFLVSTGAKAFQFQTNSQKVESFMAWLKAQEELGILQIVNRPGLVGAGSGAWTDMYIESSYAKGIRRSRTELIKAGYPTTSTDSAVASVRATMMGPIHADQVAGLYARTFENLKSVMDVANGQIRQRMADGLTTGLARGIAEGKNPRVIARELYKNTADRLDKIGKTRLRTIARTEVIRSHHVANIAEYKSIGGDIGVNVIAEWSTAGFNVCELCIDFQMGGPYKLDVIYDMIPAHPNCRCVAIPIPYENLSKKVA